MVFFFQELISSPLGSKHSQTDSQSASSQSNDQGEPGQIAADTTCVYASFILYLKKQNKKQ